MKKIVSVLMTVMLLLTVIAPAVSFTGFGAFNLEIDDGGYIDSQLAAYSSQLSEIINNYEDFRSYVVSCMKNCQSPIDISSYHISRDYKEYLSSAIFYDMTEAFHVSGGYSISYNKTTNYITKLNITYNMTKYEYDAAMAICDEVSNSFITDLVNNDELSQAEKALLVHDRLDQWCEYDTASYYSGTVSDLSHEMYGALVDGVAVCSGYSRAYKYTLEKLGIDCYLCDSDNMNHEWNIVIIDGVKYHVDTTWDDPSWDVYGRVTHTNFLRSTNGIIATGHDGGDFDTSPTDTKYDSYFWQCSKTEFQYKNGIFYYYDTTNKQLKMIEDGTTSVLKTFTDKWRAYPSGYYTESYLRLDSDSNGDYLFYSTPEHIMKYDLETGTSTVAYTPELPPNCYWIYGFKAQNNHFYIDIIDYPNADSETRDSSLCVRYQDDIPPAHFSVKSDSTAVIASNGQISGLKTELTLSQLTDKFLDYEGVELTVTKAFEAAIYYGTGSTISVAYPDGTTETYTIVICGDVDGDGFCNAQDSVYIACLCEGMLTQNYFSDCELAAADCCEDGIYDYGDVSFAERNSLN